MALSQALENLIKTLPADDQATMRAQLEKHQELRDGYLRQDDYSNKMREHQEELERGRRAAEAFEEAKEKANENYKFWETEKQRADRLEAELTAATAKAAAGAGVDAATLEKNIAEQIRKDPHLSQEGIQKLIADEAVKLQKNFFEQTLPNTMTWVSDMARAERKYEKEFGEEMDRTAFAKLMKEEQIGDPNKAYDRFTANARQERALEAAKKKAVDDYLKEHAGEGMPGTGVYPSSGEKGAVQAKISRTEGGTGYGAAEAAQALAAAGKG